MNPLITVLGKAAANKHTTGAAVVFFVAKDIVAKVGPVWFPNHADQLKQTADIIEGLALPYGLLMAGDAKESGKEEVKPEQSTKDNK